MAVAAISDVEAALGRPISSTDEQNQVNWWLDGLEIVIRSRLGDVTLLDQEALVYVEGEAAAAKVRRNGSPETSITVSVDDGAVTRRYDNPASAADIADAWWDLLSPGTGSGAFSTRPGFEADTSWWPVRTPGCYDSWSWVR